MNLQKRESDLVTSFQWRERTGDLHNIKDMTTSHLFFTLRMIWNHSVPRDMQIEPYKKYHFSSFYTVEYLTKAVREISRELVKRDDMTPYFIKCLKIIQGHLNTTLGETKTIERKNK